MAKKKKKGKQSSEKGNSPPPENLVPYELICRMESFPESGLAGTGETAVDSRFLTDEFPRDVETKDALFVRGNSFVRNLFTVGMLKRL